MGVLERMKQLHKQTLLKLSNIKRVIIAKEAGADSETYLNRARTLNSYLGNEVDNEQSQTDGDVTLPVMSGDEASMSNNGGQSEEEAQKESNAPQQTQSSAKRSPKSSSVKL